MTPNLIDHKREKFIVLIGLTLFWFVSSLVNLLATQTEPAYSIIYLLSTIGGGVGILFWCKIDAEERAAELTKGLQFALVAFGIFALIYYLFKTREKNSRLKTFGGLLLYVLGSYILIVLMVAVSLIILKTVGIEMPQLPVPQVSEP
ncbi:hypothetical protein BH10ACI2_BH10ACI2_19730 [soil metagenome]